MNTENLDQVCVLCNHPNGDHSYGSSFCPDENGKGFTKNVFQSLEEKLLAENTELKQLIKELVHGLKETKQNCELILMAPEAPVTHSDIREIVLVMDELITRAKAHV